MKRLIVCMICQTRYDALRHKCCPSCNPIKLEPGNAIGYEREDSRISREKQSHWNYSEMNSLDDEREKREQAMQKPDANNVLNFDPRGRER